MNLFEQVCSLKLAKRLKELGVKQESLFYWQTLPGHGFIIHAKNEVLNYITESCSAFTVAELGEILRIFELENTSDHEIDYYNTYSDCLLILKPFKKNDPDSFYAAAKTEADCRAKMLIHLIERGLFEV